MDSLGHRMEKALNDRSWSSADLAREAGSTTPTVSNWVNDMVKVDHVKAVQLFSFAETLGVDPRWLLLGDVTPRHVRESQRAYQSQAVKSDVLKLSLQLVEEALAERDHVLPPHKKAEAIQLAYALIEEGMPQAKVLRFVLAAVA